MPLPPASGADTVAGESWPLRVFIVFLLAFLL